MKTFLEHVAKDILSKYGTDLSRTAVVFPNKRASLFLNDALARLAQRPMWSPTYITISDLFRRHSPLQVADPIKLVCDLHRTYTDVTGFDETIDHFYGWGQLLVSDFDDIDKNMAPADLVFANLRDYREYDDVSYLTDDQRAVIRKFFSNFSDDHNTVLKERFLRLWSNMGTIYHQFNQRLQAQGLAYEGALYRQVVDDEKQQFLYDRYIFVGFNLLQTVERRLFARLKAEGKARFYWDCDRYYMSKEAGYFIAQYLGQFPNELPTDDAAVYNAFQQPKHITIATAPTEDIQARYAGQWLSQDPIRISDGRRTAIVLCNEALLPTVVHSLPEAVSQVNITTGYPLQLTPVASMVERMLRDHTLDQIISSVTESARRQADQDDPFSTEAHFRIYTLLNRLKTLVDSGDLAPLPSLLAPLTMQLIQQTTIPFHGEPAVGLQVMGVLETRNLDFDHVLMLSANEGNLPRGVTDSSFIPYSLRRAFGLTTADHKAAIYAYYFYRLLSRASDVTIVYSNASTDGQAAEMSRYMLQLMVEDGHHHINHLTLQAGQQLQPLRPRPFDKTPAVVQALRQRFEATDAANPQPLLTPTAINRYMRCPLQFYYCYVEGLREPDDTEEGVIDNRVFGNIFHNAAELLYRRITQQSRLIQPADLELLLKTRVDIERAVDEALAQELAAQQHSQAVPRLRNSLNGLQIINREVIIHYLRQLLETDRQLAPFSILQLEYDVVQPLPIASLGITTAIGGRVDRMDMVGADGGRQIRVIDYKTGGYRLKPFKTVDDIFDPRQLHNHNDYYLQTLLYARIVKSTHHDCPVAPALLFIQHAAADDYNPVLKLGSDYINDVATPDGDRFVRLLIDKVNEIFDPRQPFVPTDDKDRCRACPYARFCGM